MPREAFRVKAAHDLLGADRERVPASLADHCKRIEQPVEDQVASGEFSPVISELSNISQIHLHRTK